MGDVLETRSGKPLATLIQELEVEVRCTLSRMAHAEDLIATLVVNCRRGGDPKAICEFIAKVDVHAYLDGQGVKMLPDGAADA